MNITKTKEQHTVYNLQLSPVELRYVIDALIDEKHELDTIANKAKKQRDLYEDLDYEKFMKACKTYNDADARSEDIKHMICYLTAYI